MSLPQPSSGPKLAPHKMTVWPMEDGRFGVDATWGGADGLRRAELARDILDRRNVKSRLIQDVMGRWCVRVGPIEGRDVLALLSEFVGER